MIARGVPGGAVCLRCRLRLLRHLSQPRYRPRPAPGPGPFQPPTHLLSRSITHIRETAGPHFDSSERKPAQSHHDKHDKSQSGSGSGSRPRDRRGSAVKRLNIHKKRMAGNRVLTEASESLGSTMLGKPGYAIVMRDAGMLQKRRKNQDGPLEDNLSEPRAEHVDIEALLDSQQSPPTLDEVRTNIDYLRPESETTLSEREFRKLQTVLTDGFLSTQLQDYIDSRRKHQHQLHPDESSAADAADSTLGKDAMSQFPWIKRMSPWVPLSQKPGTMEDVDPALRGYLAYSMTAKEKLAIRIMREHWGLSMAELSTGLGETKIKMRHHDFVLLMRGSKRFVNHISEIWLAPGEKIEAFRAQKTLRLVTAKPKVAVLLQELSETLGGVTEMTFPLKLITANGQIDDEVLEEVGRITNTHIRKSATTARVHVTWIELKHRRDDGLVGLEDLRHIVVRLLLTAFNPKQAGRSASTLHLDELDHMAGGRCIIDTTCKEKLGWKDKLQDWARYVLPLTPESGPSALKPPFEKLMLPFESHTNFPPDEASRLDPAREFFPSTPFPAYPVKWSSELKTSTVARFGHLLYATRAGNALPSLPGVLEGKHRRILSPVTPHPLHLARLEGDYGEAAPLLFRTKSTIVIRFWPSPALPIQEKVKGRGKSRKAKEQLQARARLREQEREQEQENEGAEMPGAPILELRLAVSDRQVEGVESLRAITQMHDTDVMLPSSLVDLRFSQTRFTMLGAPDAATLVAWQPLADFLGKARLDLENGKLEMPPHQRFPIPRRLFSVPPDAQPDWSPGPPDELISTSYTYVGLELHRSVSLPHEGHRLTYTSIEAGQGGGRRAEVSLEPAHREVAGDEEAAPAAATTMKDAEGEGENGGEKETLATRETYDDFMACCYRFAKTNSLWSGYVVDRRKP